MADSPVNEALLYYYYGNKLPLVILEVEVIHHIEPLSAGAIQTTLPPHGPLSGLD